MLGFLELSERLLTIAVALGWNTSWFKFSFVGLVCLGALHRAFRWHARLASTSALFRAVVRAAFFRADSQEKDNVMGLTEGVHGAARLLVDVVAPGCADVLALLVGCVVVIARLDFDLGLVGALVAVTALCLFGASRALVRKPTDAFAAYLATLDAVSDAFDGRSEILAASAETAYLRSAEERIDRWRRVSLAAESRAAFLGRIPLAAGLLVVVMFMQAGGAIAAQLVLLASIAPALVGIVRAGHELSRTTERIRPLVRVLSRRTTSSRLVERPPQCITSIRWSGLSFLYGDHEVLHRVTASVSAGEVVGLVGPNGSGKTTLLKVLVGLLEPSGGKVLVNDQEPIDPANWHARVRYLPQRPYLLPRRSIRVAMNFPEPVDDEVARKVLERTGLWARLRSFPGDPLDVGTDELSAGERQRLALARMLAHDADVYLLDEPDANLDLDGIAMVKHMMRELAGANKIVIVAVHTPDVLSTADQIVRLGFTDSTRQMDNRETRIRRVAES